VDAKKRERERERGREREERKKKITKKKYIFYWVVFIK